MSITGDNRSRMYFGFDELICPAKELSSNDHDGSSPVADFFVLLLCKIDKDASSGVLDFKQR